MDSKLEMTQEAERNLMIALSTVPFVDKGNGRKGNWMEKKYSVVFRTEDKVKNKKHWKNQDLEELAGCILQTQVKSVTDRQPSEGVKPRENMGR